MSPLESIPKLRPHQDRRHRRPGVHASRRCWPNWSHAGVDVFRLNMAHAEPRRARRRLSIASAKSAAQLEQPIGILVDLAGPEDSPGRIAGRASSIAARANEYRFVRGDSPHAADELVTTYEPLVDELSVGDSVMLADGTVSMVVEETARSTPCAAASCSRA